MVDFRYHIVSIVAVFLALAIGIVLGAGPLKTSSDVQLKAQVSDLRTAQSALQGSLDQTRGQVEFLDRFGAEVAPSLLGGRLAGLDVAVVALPGADPSTVAGVVAALRQASATVSVQARLTGSWTDPGRRATLTAALDAGSATPVPRRTPPEVSATPVAPAAPSAAATVYVDAARELATAILTSARSALPTVTTPTVTSTSPASPATSATRPGPSATARVTATGGPTVSVTGKTPTGRPTGTGRSTGTDRSTGTGRPTGVPGRLGRRGRPGSSPRTTTPVPVSSATGHVGPTAPVRRVRPDPGAVAARTLTALVDGGFVQLAGHVPRVHPTLAVVVAADPPRPVDDGARAAVAELASLADALRAGSDGTVVTGDAAAAGDGGLLALVRATRPAAGGLSTVDSVDTPAGRIAVPLALVQQQSDGRVGQYGSVGSTDGPLPQLPGIGPG